MTDQATDEQLYELDRALLDEHGPSHIETICSFADGMQAEGRVAGADEALRQCDRMRAILLPNRDLVAHYHAGGGDVDDPWADALNAEVERRGWTYDPPRQQAAEHRGKGYFRLDYRVSGRGGLARYQRGAERARSSSAG